MLYNLTSKKNGDEYSSLLTMLLNSCSNPKLGLERIYALLKEIGFYKGSMQVVQVVGTNGKGSTVAFIEAMLIKNRISTGLFSSPHLCTARERIRINGQIITKDQFIVAAKKVLLASKNLEEEASFFECMLAMAMWLFKKHKVQVAIVEAGLGGRLDATSSLNADVLGVTMIHLDHQRILGDCVEKIATEKILAARRNQQVISVMQQPSIELVIDRAKKDLGFFLSYAAKCKKPLGLYGEHQKINAGLALKILEKLPIKIEKELCEQGLLLVSWPGRFELIKGKSPVILDGAHNPSGLLALVNAIKNFTKSNYQPLIFIYGSLRNINAKNKIEILLNSKLNIKQVFLHHPKNKRALSYHELKALFLASGFGGKTARFKNLQMVKDMADQSAALVVVCGSLYTVGEIRSELFSIELDQTPNY